MPGPLRGLEQRASRLGSVLRAGSFLTVAAGAGVLAGGSVGLLWQRIVLSNPWLPDPVVRHSPWIFVGVVLSAAVVGSILLVKSRVRGVVLGAMALVAGACFCLSLLAALGVYLAPGERLMAAALIGAVTTGFAATIICMRSITAILGARTQASVPHVPQRRDPRPVAVLALVVWLVAGPVAASLWRNWAGAFSLAAWLPAESQSVAVGSPMYVFDASDTLVGAIPASGVAASIGDFREGCCVLILRPLRRAGGNPDYQLQLGVRDPHTGLVDTVSPLIIGDVYASDHRGAIGEADFEPLCEELIRLVGSGPIRTTTEAGTIRLGARVTLRLPSAGER